MFMYKYIHMYIHIYIYARTISGFGSLSRFKASLVESFRNSQLGRQNSGAKSLDSSVSTKAGKSDVWQRLPCS